MGSSLCSFSTAYAIWSEPKSVGGKAWVAAVLSQAGRARSLMPMSMLSLAEGRGGWDMLVEMPVLLSRGGGEV